MTTFVLVHGSFHGGWCWRFVAPMLRNLGHDVHTPTLTGIGAKSHLLHCGVDLNTHIEDVANLLFCEDLSRVTLVGHSYAGMVITGVAARMPERIAKLIYFDAYVPSDGQSEVDLWPPAASAGRMFVRPSESNEMRPPPSLSVFGINDTKMADWVAARLVPQPMSTYVQAPPASSPTSRAIPRAYIHCTSGPFLPMMARFAAKARSDGWEVRELASGHDAMLTHPQELTNILIELAG
ncbi:MAG TPA: alpha/beta hydrolase [Candidatus Bathyarchaeia archaeon]|nr:alpha/beta hydrolase [Candidatus Bathyarchaeia archaeon]